MTARASIRVKVLFAVDTSTQGANAYFVNIIS